MAGRAKLDKITCVVAKTRFEDLEEDTMIGKNFKGAILTLNNQVAFVV